MFYFIGLAMHTFLAYLISVAIGKFWTVGYMGVRTKGGDVNSVRAYIFYSRIVNGLVAILSFMTVCAYFMMLLLSNSFMAWNDKILEAIIDFLPKGFHLLGIYIMMATIVLIISNAMWIAICVFTIKKQRAAR